MEIRSCDASVLNVFVLHLPQEESLDSAQFSLRRPVLKLIALGGPQFPVVFWWQTDGIHCYPPSHFLNYVILFLFYFLGR